jgi:transcriptional regulator with XRE-family HTH domain
MPKDLSSVKLKVIQLRVNKQLSLREIHQQTGVSKGTLSNWLKPYPLPEEIRKAKQAIAYESQRSVKLKLFASVRGQ